MSRQGKHPALIFDALPAAVESDSELVMGEKFGPQLQAAGVVHGEDVHGGATDGRNPHDAHATE